MISLNLSAIDYVLDFRGLILSSMIRYMLGCSRSLHMLGTGTAVITVTGLAGNLLACCTVALILLCPHSQFFLVLFAHCLEFGCLKDFWSRLLPAKQARHLAYSRLFVIQCLACSCSSVQYDINITAYQCLQSFMLMTLMLLKLLSRQSVELHAYVALCSILGLLVFT